MLTKVKLERMKKKMAEKKEKYKGKVQTCSVSVFVNM